MLQTIDKLYIKGSLRKIGSSAPAFRFFLPQTEPIVQLPSDTSGVLCSSSSCVGMWKLYGDSQTT